MKTWFMDRGYPSDMIEQQMPQAHFHCHFLCGDHAGIPENVDVSFFFFFFFFYIQQIKDTTHNKSKRKILTHGQTRTLNQTIQNNRYQPRTPQGTMRYRQSPGPTKNKPTIN